MASNKNVEYLIFCDKCGTPKLITKFIMYYYLKQMRVENFLCSECGYKNKFPNYIIKLLDELLSS